MTISENKVVCESKLVKCYVFTEGKQQNKANIKKKKMNKRYIIFIVANE